MAGTTHRSSHTYNSPRDHHAEVTDQIIAALEAGAPPWRKPWDSDKAGGPGMPRNATTGATYRGINVLTLGMSPLAFGSGDPRWATYKQAAERGWQVRKGARGTTAFFYKRLEVRDTTRTDGDPDATRRIPLLRGFTLFHASQIEGIGDFVPPTVAEEPWRAPEAAEVIVANSGAAVRVGGDRAFYAPATDHIQVPPAIAFKTPDGLASTMLHELCHWSGHASRLNRDLRGRFGGHEYAREELRAEIGQTMICAELGIGECEFSNNVGYIANWLEVLRSDRREIFRATADAQRIANYLLAFHPDWGSRMALATELAATEQTSANDADGSGANDLIGLAAAA